MYRKTGLVLEGGAMRGIFTAGIMDVMMEHGISYDGAIGVSAGACFGCNYKSGQPGRVIRYVTRYSRDPRFCGIRSLVKTGDFFGADFCYREIPDRLDPFDYEGFAASSMAFYVVATDARTGEAVYHDCLSDGHAAMDWIRASASMPLASKPVKIGKRELLDGGVADSVPLRRFESMGYAKNVVVLTQPRNYVKKPNKLLPAMRLCLKQYPGLLQAMEKRHTVYNASTRYVFRAEEEGRAFVFCPDVPLPIRRTETDPVIINRVYQIGRKTAEARLDDLVRFLQR